jgi:hypothetical protein
MPSDAMNCSIECPNCHTTEYVQKVSDFVGQRNWSESQSGLVERLAPPPRLELNSQLGCLYVLLSFLWSLIAIVFFIIFIAVLPGVTQNPYFLFILVFVLWFGVLGWWCWKQGDWDNNEYNKYRKTWQAEHGAAWARWDQLFFFHRFDGVFLPGKEFVPIDHMMEFLYTPENNK